MAYDHDSEIARHIERYGALLAQQVKEAGGWPATFRFPAPTTDTESEALRMFVRELEEAAGGTVKLLQL